MEYKEHLKMMSVLELAQELEVAEYKWYDMCIEELERRCEPSPIVKAMLEWKDSITISYFNKILYYNGVEYRLESVIGNSLSAHATEQEAITALLG